MLDYKWMPMADEIAQRFDPITTDFCYIRLIGDRKEIESITTTWNKEVIDRGERLQRWAEFLADLHKRGVSGLVYVNNHYAGFAPATVRRLQEMFKSRQEIAG